MKFIPINTDEEIIDVIKLLELATITKTNSARHELLRDARGMLTKLIEG